MNIEELYRAHALPLTRYINRRFGTQVDCEDVAHEAFTRLEKRSVDGIKKPASYLYFTAVNIAIDVLRKNKQSVNYEDEVTYAEDVTTQVPQPDRFVIAREELKYLRNAIMSLSPKRREAFLLIRVQGMSYKKAAKQMGISPNTIERHMVKALAFCRVEMAKYRENNVENNVEVDYG